ncbi:MAG: large conductance mechanosensitive channel protein MscL [Saprospiraceae bacterium]|nr:large conductance mechanosensitive channel protein MscL [Saprospiraceae bacterium]
MIQELKAFLFRGDVLALAVAVIIAGAFQKIIDSLVSDIIMPILALIIGEPDFSGIVIGGKEVVDAAGKTTIEGGIMIGNFIDALVKFVIIGTVLFMLIKAAGKKAEDVK